MKKKHCLMFAGQSIQESGMCSELWKNKDARQILERLKPSLGEDLEHITTQMADAELALTFNAQRAIHAHHLGHWFAYKAARPDVELDGTIGHSMGVVAALVAAEAISVEDSGLFMRARAQGFSDVCKTLSEPMGLAAASTDDFNDVVEAVKDFPGLSTALYNTIGKGSIGGPLSALQAFQKKAAEEDWPVKIKVLRVEGPYHTPAFAPCKAALTKALEAITVRPPQVPVFMGTSGKAETNPENIRRLLVDQADNCELHLAAVRSAYAAGCRNFLEISFKPQPVTWLSDQLRDESGAAFPATTATSVTTSQIAV
jgi:[acyl-carrier-protein] S-malonyltransferase